MDTLRRICDVDSGMKPSEAIQRFGIPGRLIHINAITRGNINDTYEAAFRDGGRVERVVLQRINQLVFPRPEWIMENMRVVTEHVSRKIREERDSGGREWGFPLVLSTTGGDDYFIDEAGGFWRVITMIEAAASYAEVQNTDHALEAGAVLGCFHRLLSEMDPSGLHDTLPGFHICPAYLARYDATVAREGGDAKAGASAEIKRLQAFVEKRRSFVPLLEDALSAGELRMQPIHGDPKIDNVMIDDSTGKGIGLVDLDTVKPGLIHYDFGDALRSVCNPAGEDATDLKDVVFDVKLCLAFVKGYMQEAGAFLTEADRRYLYDSVRLLTFELGLRFLEDHLAGNVYFKVRFEEHNLNRARVQFKLCESIEANEAGIRAALGEG